MRTGATHPAGEYMSPDRQSVTRTEQTCMERDRTLRGRGVQVRKQFSDGDSDFPHLKLLLSAQIKI